jgi:hypothetical protein
MASICLNAEKINRKDETSSPLKTNLKRNCLTKTNHEYDGEDRAVAVATWITGEHGGWRRNELNAWAGMTGLLKLFMGAAT